MLYHTFCWARPLIFPVLDSWTSHIFEMIYKPLFTTGAANTVAQGLLWFQCGNEQADLSFVAFAVHNLIAIVELNTYTVVRTLRSGQGIITSLDHCVCPITGSIYLVAAADDGCVRVWTKNARDGLTEWSAAANFEGLVSSASALSCYFASNNNMLVAATDSKGNVVVWLYDPLSSQRTGPHKLSSWRLPPAQMAKSVHITVLPNCDGATTKLVAYIGSVDARIHIYTARLSDISFDRTDAFKFAGAVAGHEEWVTSLSSLPIDSKSMFLASCSQDSKIRVWNIKAQVLQSLSATSSQQSAAMPGADLDVEDDTVEGDVIVEANEDELESEARLQFCVDNIQYSVLLESLLVGHEDWVTSVHWIPTSAGGEYRLFSTSMDRNMVIWSPDASAGGVWVPKVRMGDIGGSLGGSIGGNLLGFVGGCICPDGRSLIGVGYGGSFHLWTQQTAEVEGEDARWVPVPFSSGHFASVNDLTWSDNVVGDYLTTVSADQTCRIFAPLNPALVSHKSKGEISTTVLEVWKEVSRPQIHGYDLNCLVQAPQPGAHTLYTAGEEKLIRAFDAPRSVLTGITVLCGIAQSSSVETARIEQAYIPELGLSNKALEFMSKQEQTEQVRVQRYIIFPSCADIALVSTFFAPCKRTQCALFFFHRCVQETRGVSSISWTAPPLESQLADFTLWPGNPFHSISFHFHENSTISHSV